MLRRAVKSLDLPCFVEHVFDTFYRVNCNCFLFVTDFTTEMSQIESDFSSDDSGLMVEDMGVSAAKRARRMTSVTTDSSTTINVIGPGDDLIGNGLYIKPDNSLYKCVMCDYTTKYISQLSLHLEKHQASTPGAASQAAASRKQANQLILSV